MASQTAALKLVLALMGLGMAGYILGPPLYWHLTEALAAVSHSSDISASSCPPCVCDCSSQPLLTIPKGLSNASFADCEKHDPEVNEDTEKLFGAESEDAQIELLLKEVKGKGKDVAELIAAGREKLASVPSGGGGGVAMASAPSAGGGGSAAPAAESKKEEKKEEKEESDDDMGFSLFEQEAYALGFFVFFSSYL